MKNKPVRIMSFDVPCVWAYLRNNGKVYTFRKYFLQDQMVYVTGIGKCERERTDSVPKAELLEFCKKYFKESGFQNGQDWFNQIKRFAANEPEYHLYCVYVGPASAKDWKKHLERDKSFYSVKEAMRAIESVKPLRDKIIKKWSYRGRVYVLIDSDDHVFFGDMHLLKKTQSGRSILVSSTTTIKATLKQLETARKRDEYTKWGRVIEKGSLTLEKEFKANLTHNLQVREGEFNNYLDEWIERTRAEREEEVYDEFDKSPIEFSIYKPLYELAGNRVKEDGYWQPTKGVR